MSDRLRSMPGGSSAPPSGPDEQLWRAVLDDWENQKLHDVLLSQCQSPARLAALAGKYRGLLGHEGRGAGAEVQLKRIAAAAMAQMVVSGVSPERRASRASAWKIALAFFFVLGTVALLRFL